MTSSRGSANLVFGYTSRWSAVHTRVDLGIPPAQQSRRVGSPKYCGSGLEAISLFQLSRVIRDLRKCRC